MPIRIESIADHIDLVPILAAWHFAEWGHYDPGGSPASWARRLGRRTLREAIPTTLVAFEGQTPIGTTSLVEHEMETRRDLSPWVAGVYVLPEHRRKGAATMLVNSAADLAVRLGVERLHLYTDTAAGLYAKLGWKRMAVEPYQTRTVEVMFLDLGIVASRD